MGIVTAQILIEESHVDSKGINPTHYMFLSEERIPTWTLVTENIRNKDNEFIKKNWYPTMENTLDDALLMIALYVIKDEEAIVLAQSSFKNFSQNSIGLYNDIDKENREKLYEISRNLFSGLKIVITVMEGSTLFDHIHVLKDYKMEIEVCTPIYSRLYYSWYKEQIEKGSLSR